MRRARAEQREHGGTLAHRRARCRARPQSQTIRYYEDIGLLPEPRRTPAGYRLYGAADRERLAFILKAREIGLSLGEISEVLEVRRMGQSLCEHVLGLLDHKIEIAGIDKQLRALEDVRQELVSLRQDADTTQCADGTVCGIIEHRARHGTDEATPTQTNHVGGSRFSAHGRGADPVIVGPVTSHD